MNVFLFMSSLAKCSAQTSSVQTDLLHVIFAPASLKMAAQAYSLHSLSLKTSRNYKGSIILGLLNAIRFSALIGESFTTVSQQ